MAKTKKTKASAPIPAGIEDDKWRARDDLHTLQRASEITADKARVRAAREEANRQKAALDRISRLDGKKL